MTMQLQTEVNGDQALSPASKPINESDVGEMLYLTGRPKLDSFLRFVGSTSIQRESDGDLLDEWHAARDVVSALEKDEAGLADNVILRELGPEYEPLLIEFLKDPIQQATFNTVPTEISIVELDRLVVYQKNIDITHSAQLEKELGPTPTQEQIFQTCLPYNHPRPPVKRAKIDSKTYVFTSPSNDLRFLGARTLDPGQVSNYAPSGDVVDLVALAFGFSSNFMNAIYFGGRLILHNGSHRAYTLRKMGITHAPCIVQHVPSEDAFEVVAPDTVTSNSELYLKSPRPPMLRDYLNPKLYKNYSVRRRLQQLIVKFEVSEADVPAF
jgi:hypothetical protein